MTATVLRSSLAVTIGGADVTEYVLDVSWSHGISQRIGSASLQFSALPSGGARWDEITITAGIVGRTVVQRFGGYVQDLKLNHWTPTVSLKATGYLGLTSVTKASSDESAELGEAQAAAGNLGTVTPTVIDGVTYYLYTPPTSTTTTQQVAGVDLSDGGAGQTDVEMIALILDRCGLTAKVGSLGGLPHTLGTQARDQFVWRRDQTALAAIGRIDDVSLGYRTIDVPGTISRQLVGPRTPGSISTISLTEGVDVLAGASIDDPREGTANRVTVSGWDNRQGTRVVSATGGSPEVLPSGLLYQTKTYNSELIEKTWLADVGEGLSCEEVALWHLREDSISWRRLTLATWRDDEISPGDQINVTLPHMAGGGYTGVAWVESVRGSLDRLKVWRQDLTLVIRADTPVEALLGQATSTLPMSLAINP
jgi:hypothetical protein